MAGRHVASVWLLDLQGTDCPLVPGWWGMGPEVAAVRSSTTMATRACISPLDGATCACLLPGLHLSS